MFTSKTDFLLAAGVVAKVSLKQGMSASACMFATSWKQLYKNGFKMLSNYYLSSMDLPFPNLFTSPKKHAYIHN